MIGVFDSGLGGLSVLAAIARALPLADLTYFADTAHVPYGSKSDEFIRSRVLAIGDYLAATGCRIIVVACNTATAAAVEALRERHPGLPIVGIEPGVKPAAIASKSGHIAILTTESTARSERLARLIRNHADSVHVHIEPCPGWATRIETLHLDDPMFAVEVTAKVLPLLNHGVDQLVLGCTHYSFLAPMLQRLIGTRVTLVDVADAVARQVSRLTTRHNNERPNALPNEPQHKLSGKKFVGKPNLHLLASANADNLLTALPRLDLDWLLPRITQPPRNITV